MNHSARNLRRLLNFYGPYLGAGVKVDHIAEDDQTDAPDADAHETSRPRLYSLG